MAGLKVAPACNDPHHLIYFSLSCFLVISSAKRFNTWTLDIPCWTLDIRPAFHTDCWQLI